MSICRGPNTPRSCSLLSGAHSLGLWGGRQTEAQPSLNKSQRVRSAKIVQEQFLPPRRPGPRGAKVVHPGSWELLRGGLREEKWGAAVQGLEWRWCPAWAVGAGFEERDRKRKTRDQHNKLISHFCRLGCYKNKTGKPKGRAPFPLPAPFPERPQSLNKGLSFRLDAVGLKEKGNPCLPLWHRLCEFSSQNSLSLQNKVWEAAWGVRDLGCGQAKGEGEGQGVMAGRAEGQLAEQPGFHPEGLEQGCGLSCTLERLPRRQHRGHLAEGLATESCHGGSRPSFRGPTPPRLPLPAPATARRPRAAW